MVHDYSFDRWLLLQKRELILAFGLAIGCAAMIAPAQPLAAGDGVHSFPVQVSEGATGPTTNHTVRCDLDRLPCVQVLNNGRAAVAGTNFALLHVLGSRTDRDRVKVIVSYANAAFGEGQEIATYSRDELAAGLSIRMTAEAGTGEAVQIATLGGS